MGLQKTLIPQCMIIVCQGNNKQDYKIRLGSVSHEVRHIRPKVLGCSLCYLYILE